MRQWRWTWHRGARRSGDKARLDVAELDAAAAELDAAWRKKVGDGGDLRWGRTQLLLRFAIEVETAARSEEECRGR